MTKSSQAIAAPLTKSIIFTVSTLLVLVLVAAQLGTNLSFFSDRKSYSVVFADTGGLQETDSVRIAGVQVGTVSDIVLKDNTQGLVTFELDEGREIPVDVTATIRWLNLTGDRYLELGEGAPGGPALQDGATIPVAQTTPALDLDVLLSGFSPLFEGLEPDQINEVSANLVSVLQGQGGSLESIFANTASLTGTLADRDKVIGNVIDNFNTVLGTLDNRSPQLANTIEQLQKLTSGLAGDRERLGESFESTNRLVTGVDDLLSKVRGPLRGTVDQVQRLTAQVNAGEAEVDKALEDLPGGYLRVSRLGSRGSTYNLFVCSLRLKTTGPDGTPVYTPWQGPNDNLERCKPDDVNPIETPEQREANDAAGRGFKDLQQQYAEQNGGGR